MTLEERGFTALDSAAVGGAAVLCGDKGPGLELIMGYVAVLSECISTLPLAS